MSGYLANLARRGAGLAPEISPRRREALPLPATAREGGEAGEPIDTPLDAAAGRGGSGRVAGSSPRPSVDGLGVEMRETPGGTGTSGDGTPTWSGHEATGRAEPRPTHPDLPLPEPRSADLTQPSAPATPALSAERVEPPPTRPDPPLPEASRPEPPPQGPVASLEPRPRGEAERPLPRAAVAVVVPPESQKSEEPRIEVRIGRIELRSAPPPAPPPAPPARRGFEEFAAKRRYQDRTWY